MRLYLFRHGIAINRMEPDCPRESERHLTEEGVVKTRRAAEGLKALGATPDVVVVSPYLRAVQTGEIAAEVLGVARELVVREELLPEADPRDLFQKLPEIAEAGDVLCAGHAPSMDELLAEAVGARGGSFTYMKKAGAACIELMSADRLPGELVWLLQPKALRRLAETL